MCDQSKGNFERIGAGEYILTLPPKRGNGQTQRTASPRLAARSAAGERGFEAPDAISGHCEPRTARGPVAVSDALCADGCLADDLFLLMNLPTEVAKKLSIFHAVAI